MRLLNRDSNTMTISAFFELHMLNKFNYEPPYQRKSVWGLEQKSFLIDTIMKNFPMPPIFLHRTINGDTGSETYNVIDGKQRLTSILDFINNEIALPDDFGDGVFGDEIMNGLYFNDLDTEQKKVLWRYKVAIEYIESDDEKTIDSVFDRLNRNGVVLNAQELRRARFNEGSLYNLVLKLREVNFWKVLLQDSVKSNRLEDEELLSDLLFYMLSQELFTSNRENLDDLYEKTNKSFNSKTDEEIEAIEREFMELTSQLEELQLDFKKYKIFGVSHIYSLWNLIVYCNDRKIDVHQVKEIIQEFYHKFRTKNTEHPLMLYREGMSRDVKSKYRRELRLKALVTYINEYLSR